MPSYFYHLAFELEDTLTSDLKPPFLPLSEVDIFSPALPSHKSSSWASYLAPRRHRRSKSGALEQRPPPSARPRSLTPCGQLSPNSIRARDQDRQQEEKQGSSPDGTTQDCDQERICASDYRFDQILLESINMESQTITALEREQIAEATHATIENAKSYALGLKGRYVPSDPTTTDIGWGVVHLYREPAESPDLDEGTSMSQQDTQSSTNIEDGVAPIRNDCTTLCILAVPSYMTPSDLLGWIGEETQELVSHFRLVRTSRSNRYMVLIKFRDSLPAVRWQRAWNGKLFSFMEPENAHIVFVKSIKFDSPTWKKDPESFPDMTNDPFTPMKHAISGEMNTASSSEDTSSMSVTTKPTALPTPALIELPTCPVCLERMDETTGLATIFCQHVFHCACLQKWQGSGCPVCRYTQDDPLHKLRRGQPRTQEEQCRICGITDSLWICLICGQVGCGRYDEAHAYAHFEQSGHGFAMDIKTQAIWDYTNDEWVHRLIQNTLDGKLVELPAAAGTKAAAESYLTKDKLEDVSLEYTTMMKGQLESQRSYFEEQVDRAVDKAAQASIAADQATATALKASERLDSMQASHQILLNETLPGLEKAKERAERRAEKFEGLSRKMEKEWKEKEVINDSLMDRIGYLEKQVNELTVKNSDLEEQNRDLTFFISGSQRLKDQGEDVQQGILEIAEPPAKGQKKKKKKGKGPKDVSAEASSSAPVS